LALAKPFLLALGALAWPAISSRDGTGRVSAGGTSWMLLPSGPEAMSIETRPSVSTPELEQRANRYRSSAILAALAAVGLASLLLLSRGSHLRPTSRRPHLFSPWPLDRPRAPPVLQLA
jgi:hypothetical protein